MRVISKQQEKEKKNVTCQQNYQYFEPEVKPHHQSSMEEANSKKRVKIYKNGDVSFKGLKVVISTDQFESVQAFLDSIKEKIDFKQTAGKLYTLSGKLIQSMDELEDSKEYVAALNIFTPLLYGYTKFVTTATGEIKKESEDASTTPLLGNTSQEDKIKGTKVVRKGVETGGNLPLGTGNNLSPCAKANFTSPSVSPAATATVATTEMLGATKMKAGHRPSTISIKNRTPTPKPTGELATIPKQHFCLLFTTLHQRSIDDDVF
uniref:Doublecortin domain-containing protein n=1 Tax=Setaria digitata TaxID=48799 RepID=A0A915Q557_9BILA